MNREGKKTRESGVLSEGGVEKMRDKFSVPSGETANFICGSQELHFESGGFPGIIRSMKSLLTDDQNMQLLLEMALISGHSRFQLCLSEAKGDDSGLKCCHVSADSLF